MPKTYEQHELILIIDFGGQYNQLIARRVRERHIYCEVKSYKTPVEEIRTMKPKGIIFTGGPNSVYLESSPKMDKQVLELGVPVLGICYGAQFMAHTLGGEIAAAQDSSLSEFGRTETFVDTSSSLFNGISDTTATWMSHNDYIKSLPEGFKVTAHTAKCPYAAVANEEKRMYGVQFHPEVGHTEQGFDMLGNFLFDICGCRGDWTMENYAETAVRDIREKVGSGRVLLALSGGVDSSVACKLLANAVGEQLTCIFVDHGLLRKNEGDEVEEAFADAGISFVRVNAAERFLARLAGISDPEAKRKIIGEEFIRVFEEEAKKLGRIDYLVQGTIYPDVIESGAGDAAVIKSHHNVGGLPDHVDFKEMIEPLRALFKDEVRALGLALGLPEKLVWRQPFPGPGLAVRIMGEVTPEKVRVLQKADAVFREEIAAAGLERSINQYFAVLTDMRSVGVMGDGRTYDHTIALRGVTTSDFMTADFARIPYDVLERVSVRIVNEVGGINRIVYDITGKPPSTIEWE